MFGATAFANSMASNKKPSLFAQRMLRVRRTNNNETTNQSTSFDFERFGKSSNVVCGLEAESIHKENIEKLAAITLNEIEDERNKLLTSLPSTLVELLKSRKYAKAEPTQPQDDKPQACTSNSDCTIKIPAPASQLAHQYPHMDVVEPEKMQWMQDPPSPKPPHTGCPYNARFNFNGELLPYCENQMTEGLYHHGEEPHRPGYTLQEIIQLSRSSVLQQRTTALYTLANILNRASEYDSCLEEPLTPQLLDADLYLLLRFSLDDPVWAVVSATLAALASLLSNTRDEGCLDRVLGLTTGIRQPSFYVHIDLKLSEIEELKDPELLKLDVIRGTLRTHLLDRLRYIMEKLNPEPVELSHILRCLIRIARHSLDAATSIKNSPGLLEAVRNLLGMPPPMASSEGLKLFRVIACQSQELAAYLVRTYSLMEPIQRFIAGTQCETSMSLVLESFYTWQTFLSYKLMVHNVSEFSPVLQRLLLWHTESVDLEGRGGDLEHAAALVSLLCCVLRIGDVGPVRGCLHLLHLCALKWLSQASQVSIIKWPACKLLDALLCTISTLINIDDFKCNDIQNKVELFLSSTSFETHSRYLRQQSWLLCGEQDLRIVESLPCLGCLPPSLHDLSPLPLFQGLGVYLSTVKSSQLSEQFVTSEVIQNYMEEVVSAGPRTTVAHWFARQEIIFLYTLLQIHVSTLAVESNQIHQVALFLSTSIHSNDRYMLPNLFSDVIFNKHFFRPDVTELASEMQNLHLNSEQDEAQRAKLLNEALDSLETICGCYQRQFGLLGLPGALPPPTLTATYQGTGPALPADWHCLPIVLLNNTYNDQNESCSQIKNSVEVVTSCLQWSLVLETLRPKFVASLNVASRFCHLACVFLAGNELFREVHPWLSAVLHTILGHNQDLDFNSPIPGLQSFYDFYRQILEQFVGVSYGDPVFCQFVLIPLQQRHHIRLRKLVWCELGAVLRFLSTPLHQVGVPLENFLEPCETDPDLLLIYLKSLAQGKVRETFCPVLYKVALHHVATYIKLYPGMPPAQYLCKLIHSLGNQSLKNLLLNYSYDEPMR